MSAYNIINQNHYETSVEHSIRTELTTVVMVSQANLRTIIPQRVNLN